MLQIRLSKTLSSDAAGTVNPSPVEMVLVACPDHLVLADVPVAKSIGGATSSLLVKTRPSACKERIHLLSKTEFESHIHESHADLLDPNAEKGNGKDLEIQSAKQPTGLDSTVRVLNKACWQQSREQLLPRPIMQPKGQPVFGQVPNYPSESQSDTNHFRQGFDRQGTPQPESSQFSDKQGSLLGFPPGPVAGVNYPAAYPPPWNGGQPTWFTDDSSLAISQQRYGGYADLQDKSLGGGKNLDGESQE
ncbi:hypothetical protein V6N13_149143 [Hibiscus sabdariffa]|uniref:Uncharacterized protein n=1 Tax=Hibiscus sabdariffa TaxID=183260 RepID=A0ABR2EI81_9ROSI